MACRAVPVIRGCGTRTKGDVYLESGTDPNGLPVEYFLQDPPIVLPMRLKAIGVTIFSRTDPDTGEGIYHVLDHVGSTHYTVAAMVEEIRLYGVSRKIPKTTDFSVFTPGKSKIFLSHAEAFVSNMSEYTKLPWEFRWYCPSPYAGVQQEHTSPDFPKGRQECCAGFWWYDTAPELGTKIEIHESSMTGRPATYKNFPNPVCVEMFSFNYVANVRPSRVEPDYREAIFAAFPITAVVVIQDDNDAHRATLDRVQTTSKIPVFESEE